MKRLFQLINRNLFQELFSGRRKTALIEQKLPLITISREMGSGGRPIAELVVEKFGKPWKLYHRDIIDDIAEESHLEKRLIKEVDENRVPLIEEVIGDFFGKRYFNLSGYYKQLVKVLTTIGQRGNAVIIGRGAHYLFPEALKVRIICEMDQRIKWMMEYENLTKSQAIKRIDDSDRRRYEFEKAVYNHDIKKAHHYNLVIRTGRSISIEDAAEIIVFTAKRRFKI